MKAIRTADGKVTASAQTGKQLRTSGGHQMSVGLPLTTMANSPSSAVSSSVVLGFCDGSAHSQQTLLYILIRFRLSNDMGDGVALTHTHGVLTQFCPICHKAPCCPHDIP